MVALRRKINPGQGHGGGLLPMRREACKDDAVYTFAGSTELLRPGTRYGEDGKASERGKEKGE